MDRFLFTPIAEGPLALYPFTRLLSHDSDRLAKAETAS
jgi:hypothetical protein